jgi:catechol 2,3-dioxygenase-like lactoylglutathione lyase family enzyme
MATRKSRRSAPARPRDRAAIAQKKGRPNSLRASRKKAAGRARPARSHPKAARRTAPARAPRKAPAARAAKKERRTPETLRLRAVNPNLTVDDLTRSVAFYTGVLGFIVSERWTDDAGNPHGVMLKAGVCEVGLSQDDWAKGRDRKKGEGFRLWFDTIQDIDALAHRIKAAGHALTEEPRDDRWGRSLSLDDPNGFHLTFNRSGE